MSLSFLYRNLAGSAWANKGAIASNLGRMALGGAKAAWANPMARSAIIGAGVGGLYGGLSKDGSVMGGALRGAGLGAMGYRYGNVAGRMAYRQVMRSNQPLSAFGWGSALGKAYGSAVGRLARHDYRGAKMLGNQGYKRIRGFWK